MLSENEMDTKAELVKLYTITQKRIEKLRDAEEKEGKLKSELTSLTKLAMKLLELIEALPKQPAKEIKISWENPQKTE